MAVTIDQMQVDVQQSAQPVQVSASTATPAAPGNPRKERQALLERELRLKAD
jgi:hypothetical protein